jgi:hypothetical protein
MTALLYHCGNSFRLGRWCLAAAVLIVGLAGCAGWNVRDEGFAENDLTQSVRKARPKEKNADYWSFSEKGRQIERDLHSM